jgi:hemin uptake protein HemP
MTRTVEEPASQPTQTRSLGEPPGVRIVSSSELMKGARLLVIRHGDAAYRLQITQGGKLILTK